MNIYNYLKKDHETVNTLFETIISSQNHTKRAEVFNELKQELLAHAEAEHVTLYKSLKEYDETKDIAKHADKEHAEVKKYLNEISEIPVKSDEWLEKLGELKHAVTHHVKEEETEMFKLAKQVLSKEQEENILQKIQSVKQKLLSDA
jgi:hemerythrin superfamily protein